MEQYQLKLNNKTLRQAIENLNVGQLYTYAFLVFSIKNGLSAKDSKRYQINENVLYEALKLYGYLRSKKTFFRHLGRLRELKLVIFGNDRTEYVDILHRFDSKDRESFTLICFSEFAQALKEFSPHDMKAFLGFRLNDAYLASKKPIGKLKSKARLEKKVIRISNRKKFFEARKKNLALSSQNRNHLIDLSDRIKQVMGQNGYHIVKKSALKELKKSAKTSIDFLNFKLTPHSLNLINWHRKKKRKPSFTKNEFQEHIRQLDFAISNKFIRPKNPEGFFFHHLVNFGSSVLNESLIGEYHHYQASGMTKREALSFEKEAFVSPLLNQESKEKSDLDRFKALNSTKSEQKIALEKLISSNSLFAQMASWSIERQIQCGFFSHLSNEIKRKRSESTQNCNIISVVPSWKQQLQALVG